MSIISFFQIWLQGDSLKPLDRSFAQWFRFQGGPTTKSHPLLKQKEAWNQVRWVIRNVEGWIKKDIEKIHCPADFLRLARKNLATLESWFAQNPVQNSGAGTQKYFSPPWLYKFFQNRLNHPLPAFPQFLTFEPGLFIRLNGPQHLESVTVELAEQKFTLTKPAGHFGFPQGWCWEIQGHRSAYLLETHQQGRWEIQDWGSQAAILKLPLRSGQKLLDLCAGEGGKTLALAERLGTKGVIWALDIHANKLEVLKKRCGRAGFFTIRPLAWDGDRVPSLGKEVPKNLFDGVVVDAPCSASGTWNKDPEAPLRTFPSDVEELANIQKHLLDEGWRNLKAGGHLLYITCSWMIEENELQTEAFLGRQPQCALISQEYLTQPGGGLYYTALFLKKTD